MEKQIDMHIHTTASDGTDTPAQVVEKAVSLGLGAIGIADHDNVGGIQEAKAAGEKLGLEVVAGIEISSDYHGHKAHMLGYFIDPDASALRPALDWAVNERADRNRKIVAAMAADGFDISLETLAAAYPDSVLGRPHMAEYLMGKGYVSSVQEAFEKYLAEGGLYYQDKIRMPMEQAVSVIHEAGGIAVLAHPLQYGYNEGEFATFVQTAAAVGIDGLEAYYSEHSEEDVRRLLALAKSMNLCVSGGSDYHGTRKPHIEMGSGISGRLCVPGEVLEGMKIKAGKV